MKVLISDREEGNISYEDGNVYCGKWHMEVLAREEGSIS